MLQSFCEWKKKSHESKINTVHPFFLLVNKILFLGGLRFYWVTVAQEYLGKTMKGQQLQFLLVL